MKIKNAVMLAFWVAFALTSYQMNSVRAQSCDPAELTSSSHDTAHAGPIYVDLSKPGKKVELGGGHYFTWRFSEKPKMGVVILKIQIFDAKGKRSTAFEISGRSDMPSMKGAHDSGEKAFKVSKKLDYLLPVDVAMPGDWEVLITFTKDKLLVFRGRIAFDV